MNRYHVTITNNETKEVEFDQDLKAVLMAGSQGKGIVNKVDVQHCTTLDIACALCGLLEIVDEEFEENPAMCVLVGTVKAVKKERKNI